MTERQLSLSVQSSQGLSPHGQSWQLFGLFKLTVQSISRKNLINVLICILLLLLHAPEALLSPSVFAWQYCSTDIMKMQRRMYRVVAITAHASIQ